MKTDNADHDTIDDRKRYFFCALLCLVLSIILLVFLNYIIYLIYRPNVDDIIQHVTVVSFFEKSNFLPEPVERLQYILSILLLPFIIIFLYNVITKIVNEKEFFQKRTDILYQAGVLGTGLGIISLSYFINMQNDFFYVKNAPVFEFFPIFLGLIFPIILLCTGISENKSSINKMFFLIFATLTVILTISMFFMTIFNKDWYYGQLAHFDAAFYPVSQVVGGKTLLVDFNNQYGLYPHFLEPIFHIIDLTVLNYSIIMSLLTAISFILIFFFLIKTVSNNVISLLGFTSITFISVLMMRLTAFDVYFQYWPIRVIFPAIFLVLTAIYIENEDRGLYYCISVLSSLAILWNLETGIIVIISWGLLLGYCEVLKQNSQDIVSAIIKGCYHILTIFLIFCVVVICYVLYILVRSGHVPNFVDFIQYQQFFYISGFYMLPMSFFHPWNIIWIIYMCGLLYAIKSLVRKEDTSHSKIIFLLTVFGLGLFSYYQGRSHDVVLLLVAYPAILLTTIFTGYLLSDVKKYGFQLYHNVLLVLVCIFFLSFSIVSIGYYNNEYYQFSARGFSALNDTPTNITENIVFIKNTTTPGERILILGNFTDGLYYGESHTVSVLNTPGYGELLYTKDFNEPRLFLLNNTNVKVYVAITDHNPGLNDILMENYSVRSFSSSKQIVLLYRNFSKPDIPFLIRDEPDKIFHKKTDTYIFPPEKICLGNNFTIQVLVRPLDNNSFKQLTCAEILGNDPKNSNSEGFVIMQDNPNRNEYSFRFGNGNTWERSAPIYLNENEWNYLTFTMDNTTFSSYHNGTLINSKQISAPLKNSDLPLYIGNWFFFSNRPFDGTIKEVMISNKSLSSDTIKTNWEYIQNNSIFFKDLL